MNKRIALLAAIAMAAIGYQSASAYTYQVTNATNRTIWVTLDALWGLGGELASGDIGAYSTRRFNVTGGKTGLCLGNISVGYSQNNQVMIGDVEWVDSATAARINNEVSNFGDTVREAGGEAGKIPNQYGQGAEIGANIVGSIMKGGAKLQSVSTCGNVYFTVYEKNGKMHVVATK